MAIQDDSDSDQEDIPLYPKGSKRYRESLIKTVREKWIDSESDEDNIPLVAYGSKHDLDNRSNAIPKIAPRDTDDDGIRDTDDDAISDDNGDGDYEANDNSDNENNGSDCDNDDDVGSNGATDNSDTEKNVSGDDNGDDTNHNRIKKKVTGKRAMENNTNTMNKKNRTEIRAPYQFIFDDEEDGDDVVDDENGDDEDGDDNVLQPALLSMLLRDKRKMFSVTGQMKKIIKNSKNYEAKISGNMLLAKLLEAGTNKGPNGKVRAAEKFHAICGELHIRPSAEIYARANGEGIDSVYADYSQVYARAVKEIDGKCQMGRVKSEFTRHWKNRYSFFLKAVYKHENKEDQAKKIRRPKSATTSVVAPEGVSSVVPGSIANPTATTTQPSALPSTTTTQPSALPSISTQPSARPSTSTQPSALPSTTTQPSASPSTSIRPSALPSTNPSDYQPALPSTTSSVVVGNSTNRQPRVVFQRPDVTLANTMEGLQDIVRVQNDELDRQFDLIRTLEGLEDTVRTQEDEILTLKQLKDEEIEKRAELQIYYNIQQLEIASLIAQLKVFKDTPSSSSREVL